MNVLSNDWGPFARTLASVLRHLQEDYPYLYSLAGRTNPFDPHARVEVRPLQ